MRVNPAVVLTSILLSLMFGAGITSAIYGYKLGRGALKGITQPDARPINNLSDAQGQPIRREGLTFLKETDILTNVKTRIEGGSEAPNPEPNQPANPPAAPQ